MKNRNPLRLACTLLLMGITAIAGADNGSSKDQYKNKYKDRDRGYPVVTVPEPGSALLLGTGLIVLGLAVRRRANKQVRKSDP